MNNTKMEILNQVEKQKFTRTCKLPTLDQVLKRYLIRVLKACDYNQSRAARIMRVNVKTVRQWMRRYDIQIEKELKHGCPQ